MKITVKESYLTNITYLQVTGRPSCDREVAAVGRAIHHLDSPDLPWHTRVSQWLRPCSWERIDR